MTHRLCPLCTMRPAAVIDPECSVCAGHGTLELGATALREYDAQTISTAIHLALEVTARAIDKRPDARNVDPRPAITKALAKLARAGLVVPPKAPAPVVHEATGTKTPPPASLVHKALGVTPDMTDQLMIRAHPYPYSFRDRPGARGLPLMSENFFPGSLARIGNKVPFERDTMTEIATRQKRRYDARSIVYYLTGVAPST